jgi:hypothetical protein
MKILKPICFVAAMSATLLFTQCGGGGDHKAESNHPDTLMTNSVDSAMPFYIEFVPVDYPGKSPLPRLQSYVQATVSDGTWLIALGRRQGLHMFMPAPNNNFVKDSANNFIWVIDPNTGDYWNFDVNQLSDNLSAPFKATNAQNYYDPNTHQLYIIGGYGWKADGSNMVTFNTIMRFHVDSMAKAVRSGANAAKITSLIQQSTDDRFAVTGGELFNMGGNFYLVFGQRFDGQYRAFGGDDFTQKYTEVVAVFNLLPNLKINSYGTTTNSESDHPFHRRDGNIIDDVDPVTGQERITALGGVFQPGIIGAYTYPIYITSPAAPTLDRTGNQKFSQYECPVITIYDSAVTKRVYHTFFGGIGHWYYMQTDSQKAVYNIATGQGRNDGFPFVEDVTTFSQGADGTYQEYIHTTPIPGQRLLGASIPFILDPAIAAGGQTYSNGVLKLSKFASGSKTKIGYIYGGIEAQNPLPLIPNTGTYVSNTVFAVYMTYLPSPGIPADQGHESTKSDANLQRK